MAYTPSYSSNTGFVHIDVTTPADRDCWWKDENDVGYTDADPVVPHGDGTVLTYDASSWASIPSTSIVSSGDISAPNIDKIDAAIGDLQQSLSKMDIRLSHLENKVDDLAREFKKS